jgi:hypothetical protein
MQIMKNNIILIITGLITFGLSACQESFLELEPKTSQMEANYYKTEAEALNAVAAVYQTLAVHNGLDFIPMLSDVQSDDAYCGGASSSDMVQWQQIESSQITAENGSSTNIWSRCYSGIYRANTYLAKQSQVTWTNPENKGRFEAEVKFCRAYFYWDLVRVFGWVPIFEINLPDVSEYKSVTQSTPADVYKQIATDLLAAVDSLPTTIPNTEKGRITQYAAKALMARIYLYYQGFAKPVLGLTGEWGNGTVNIDKAYVQDALDDIIAGPYELLPNYADIFKWDNQNNAESIFELQYSEKGKSGDWSSNYWNAFGNVAVIMYGIRSPEGDATLSSGWSFAPVSWSAVKEFETADPRLDATVYNADTKLASYAKGYQNTGYFNKKYLPLKAYEATQGSRELNFPKNYIDIRLADVYLMAAEVYLDDNNSKAAGYLSEVRMRALGAGAKKETITLDDIYHERRVELCGEGHRKWDLIRRGLDYTAQKINESKELPDGIPNAADFQNISFATNTWGMLPVPAVEIRNTNEGTLRQYVPAYQ